MVPVGDQRPAAGQVGGDRSLLAGIAQPPQPVGDAVLGGDRHQRRPLVRNPVHDLGGRRHGLGVRGVGELPAVVDEEDRLQVRLRGRHQLTPAGDQARHDVLVREDARRFRRAEADQADDAALEQGGARSRQALLVDVERGHPVPDEHARRQPLAQQAGLAASPRARVRGLAWQDETDHVVRVRRPELVENAAVNHVVRWGRDVCDTAYPVTGITDAAEGCQHEAGTRVGRKGLHIMSKGSAASGDSHREENVPGQPLSGGSADDVHAWYRRGMDLLGRGSPAAAAQVLQRAATAEPGSRSVREALARAQFDAGRYEEAADNFRVIVEASIPSAVAATARIVQCFDRRAGVSGIRRPSRESQAGPMA